MKKELPDLNAHAGAPAENDSGLCETRRASRRRQLSYLE
jgi:hypothetical protein